MTKPFSSVPVVWFDLSRDTHTHTLQLLFITGLDGDTVSEVPIAAGARPNDNKVMWFVITNMNICWFLYRDKRTRGYPHPLPISNVVLGCCSFDLCLVGSFIFIEAAWCCFGVPLGPV